MTDLALPKYKSPPLRTAALAIWGLLSLGNALWMLADPAGWYASIDGVPNTGPYNHHFVRDIGVAYLTLALLVAGAIRWPGAAVPLLSAVTLYLALHALLHVWDIAAARLPAEHLLVDLPGVFAPPFISAALTWWARPTRF